MSENQKMNIRVIGDTGNFIDLDIEVEPFEPSHNDTFFLRSYPGADIIKRIKTEICGNPECDCKKHHCYRIRDIYSDGNVLLEILVEKAG